MRVDGFVGDENDFEENRIFDRQCSVGRRAEEWKSGCIIWTIEVLRVEWKGDHKVES